MLFGAWEHLGFQWRTVYYMFDNVVFDKTLSIQVHTKVALLLLNICCKNIFKSQDNIWMQFFLLWDPSPSFYMEFIFEYDNTNNSMVTLFVPPNITALRTSEGKLFMKHIQVVIL